jgi:hypothetical protein
LLVLIGVLLFSGGPADLFCKEFEVEIPRGSKAVIDGTLDPVEWSGAHKTEFAGGGELLLMHEGGHLYVGVRDKPAPVVSICVFRGDEVAVMHMSAALGTAVYKQRDDEWERVTEFSWSCRDASDTQRAWSERAEHLKREGWVGSNGRMGVAEETEFKMALPSDEWRISVTCIGSPDYEWVSRWPTSLEDDSVNLDLIRGSAPKRLKFEFERWASVSAMP